MRSQVDLINRFRDGARTGAASNIFIDGDIIYSYGQHFPLAVRRKWGAGIAYLINGDRYSISTASHQRQCITKLTPNVQVPFSALIAAGLTHWQRVPRSELRIAAHQSDRYYETCTHCGREVIGAQGATSDPPTCAYRHADDATPLCSAAEGRNHSHQEGWGTRAYFLCELPCPAGSVEEAFDALVPQAVTDAKTVGTEVHRQGDTFVIATSRETREIRAATQRHFRLFGTAHIATEARINGAVYVRGVLRHAPPGRRSQHARLQLGKTWWLAAKNLALASWNAAGNVD
jgi:hypothetical protein